MVLLPARCRDCGHAWQPAAVNADHSLDMRVSVGFIACPKCGGHGEIALTANVIDGAIEMLPGSPQWSVDLVRQLGLDLKRIVEEEPEDPVADLAKSNRELAAAIDRAAEALRKQTPRTTKRRTALKVMGFLVGSVFSAGLGVAAERTADDVLSDEQPAIDPVEIRREVDRQLKEIERTGRLPRHPPRRGPERQGR